MHTKEPRCHRWDVFLIFMNIFQINIFHGYLILTYMISSILDIWLPVSIILQTILQYISVMVFRTLLCNFKNKRINTRDNTKVIQLGNGYQEMVCCLFLLIWLN